MVAYCIDGWRREAGVQVGPGTGKKPGIWRLAHVFWGQRKRGNGGGETSIMVVTCVSCGVL